MTDLAVDQPDRGESLVVTDLAIDPGRAPRRHPVPPPGPPVASARNLWAHREIMYTLAERDFRAQYKQAVLGMAWAVLSPVATLTIFVIVFSHLKSAFPTQGIPYALYAFVGILCWSFFARPWATGGRPSSPTRRCWPRPSSRGSASPSRRCW